ncbi:uncharacterized protein LOC117304824 [Asterias rubens]|uniref:uncharacterized protein LOC117304824 n=1 Tax=Asterias rubens TaxID=7604 RepID=UPI00145588C9|nr:uncharacterized protein LOC117304824 [Asterias rubens]
MASSYEESNNDAIALQPRKDTVPVEEGSVKLTGGANGLQGFLQVYVGGKWGTVCNEEWDKDDADVVCKQLGASGGAMFTESSHSLGNINSSLPVHMSMANCSGTERKLTECAHSNVTQCTHASDVKIDCVIPGYKACVTYDPQNKPLNGRVLTPVEHNINECARLCRSDGYAYVGIRPLECHCGSVGEDFESVGVEPNENCGAFCRGAGSQNCGSDGSLAIHDVAVGSCSGKFKSKYGAVTSPEFPGSYPRDARTCQWIVDVSENGDTTIQFPVFDIDDGDALEITIDGGESWQKYSMAKKPDRMTFDLKEIIVRFIMGGTNANFKGFIMTYQDDTTCDIAKFPNGTLDTQEGAVYRPGDLVEVVCNKGYESEWVYSMCNEEGAWDKTPECKESPPPGRSLIFTSTYLFMMLAVMGSLGIIFFMIICGVICVGRKKKKEGYTGISRQESAEPTKAANEYHVEMHGGSDIDMQNARGEEGQGIPLASEAMDE